jgi:hypothetical protein
MTEVKRCSKCGETKPLTEFHFRRDRNRYRAACKCCINKQNLDNYNNSDKSSHKRSAFIHNLKRYGLTESVFLEMYEQQEHKCKICGRPIAYSTGNAMDSLHIDHDHETGKVRGLLCGDCNTGLGKFKDNTEILSKAIRYLNDSQTS